MAEPAATEQRFDLPIDTERLLRGRLILPPGPGPFPLVLCAHGYTGFMDWGFWPPWSVALAARGIASVRFNFPGTGIGADLRSFDRPELFQANTYRRELEELAAVRDWIRASSAPIDQQRVGILGHSRGGGMAVVHAAEAGLEAYRAVATWNGLASILRFSDERLAEWRREGALDVFHHSARRRVPLPLAVLEDAEAQRARLDPTAAAGRLQAPLLVVQGEVDRDVTMEDARALFGAAPRASLSVIPEGDHVFGARHPLERIGPILEQVLRLTGEWFERTLCSGMEPEP